MKLLESYLECKTNLAHARSQLDDAEIALYDYFKGSFNDVVEGYRVKIICKDTITVDQSKCLPYLDVMRTKYELDAKKFKALPDDVKSEIEIACITTKPAKPSFCVELS